MYVKFFSRDQGSEKKCSNAADVMSSIALNGGFQYHMVIKLYCNHGGCLIKAGIN